MHPYQNLRKESHFVPHWVGGQWRGGSGPKQQVCSPYTGQPMLEFQPADARAVDEAVRAARIASVEWGLAPPKERARVLFALREEILKDLPRLAATKSFESGKTLAEAEAGLMKGLEVLEFALSLQNLDTGQKLEVSRGVHCEFRRVPLGVVAGITPFNFPAMVPMWMMPIAIALGNAFVWKPSDKVPMTSQLLGECWQRAGLPAGVLTILQGGVDTVNALIDHPEVRAVGFVGSTPAARAVYTRASGLGKRALALGGAKNHIILMPDADLEMAAQGISDSFTGCAGQRCMAASVLVAVGDCERLIERITERASAHRLGETMGAIITKAQVEFLNQAIERAVAEGATIRLDGRKAPVPREFAGGNWIGPTLLDQVKPQSEAATRELFGPILSIVRVETLREALELDASSAYGNATSVFTSSGAVAEEVARHAQSGMIGINIGVPVPREPFSFGGTFESKFGHGDITGVASLGFWSDLRKITTKWAPSSNKNWMS